ncbi:unnamed protein product [Boreogadus saida]
MQRLMMMMRPGSPFQLCVPGPDRGSAPAERPEGAELSRSSAASVPEEGQDASAPAHLDGNYLCVQQVSAHSLREEGLLPQQGAGRGKQASNLTPEG